MCVCPFPFNTNTHCKAFPTETNDQLFILHPQHLFYIWFGFFEISLAMQLVFLESVLIMALWENRNPLLSYQCNFLWWRPSIHPAFHPSIHPFSALLHFAITSQPCTFESVPAVSGWLLVYHWATWRKKQPSTLAPMANLKLPVSQICASLWTVDIDEGKNTKAVHIMSLESGFEPATFLLEGDSANHCTPVCI